MKWQNKYLSPILYLGSMLKTVLREDKIENAKIELGKTLDFSVKAETLGEDSDIIFTHIVEEAAMGRLHRAG